MQLQAAMKDPVKVYQSHCHSYLDGVNAYATSLLTGIAIKEPFFFQVRRPPTLATGRRSECDDDRWVGLDTDIDINFLFFW